MQQSYRPNKTRNQILTFPHNKGISPEQHRCCYSLNALPLYRLNSSCDFFCWEGKSILGTTICCCCYCCNSRRYYNSKIASFRAIILLAMMTRFLLGGWKHMQYLFTGHKESVIFVHFFRYLFSICLVFFPFYYQYKYIYRNSILKNKFKSNFIRNNFRLNGYHHLKGVKLSCQTCVIEIWGKSKNRTVFDCLKIVLDLSLTILIAFYIVGQSLNNSEIIDKFSIWLNNIIIFEVTSSQNNLIFLNLLPFLTNSVYIDGGFIIGMLISQ